MKSIESVTSTDATSREHLERCSSDAKHRRKRYVGLRTDKTRGKCFTDNCCQSLSFAMRAPSVANCARRHWLSILSNANFHQILSPDRVARRGVGA